MLALLSGFILGAMVRLWPWKETSDAASYQLTLLAPQTYALSRGSSQLLQALLMGLLGLIMVLLLEWLSTRRKKEVA